MSAPNSNYQQEGDSVPFWAQKGLAPPNADRYESDLGEAP